MLSMRGTAPCISLDCVSSFFASHGFRFQFHHIVGIFRSQWSSICRGGSIPVELWWEFVPMCKWDRKTVRCSNLHSFSGFRNNICYFFRYCYLVLHSVLRFSCIWLSCSGRCERPFGLVAPVSQSAHFDCRLIETGRWPQSGVLAVFTTCFLHWRVRSLMLDCQRSLLYGRAWAFRRRDGALASFESRLEKIRAQPEVRGIFRSKLRICVCYEQCLTGIMFPDCTSSSMSSLIFVLWWVRRGYAWLSTKIPVRRSRSQV